MRGLRLLLVCDGVIVRIQVEGEQFKKWRPRGTVTVPLESIHNTTGGMASTVPLIFGYRSLFEEIGSKRFRLYLSEIVNLKD